MKTSIKLICASLLAMVMVSSCKKEVEPVTFASDPTALTDVPCKDPSDQVLNLQTNANWIVVTPEWVTANPVFGSGNTIVTFSVTSTYINEKTDVNPRSGEIVFSGGGKSYVVPISQLGYTAPYDPTASIGGIPDVKELMDFVEAVNNNDGITRWQNANKEVELLADLDITDESKDWTPIGNPETVSNGNYLGSYTGPAFKGVFNGAGHTIKGFNPTVKVAENGTFGFFGVLDGATVKDLTIDTDIKLSAASQADAGVLVGTSISSTIQNVRISGSLTSTGNDVDNKRYAVGGIAGFVFNTASAVTSSVVKDCNINLIVNVAGGANTKNGATGAMYGGVAGFLTTAQDDSRNIVENCVNNGEITANIGRCSGICATANYGGYFTNCTNNANQTNSFVNGRIGNVISVLYKNAKVEGLVNNGNLTTTDSQTHAGAIVGFFNDDAIVMTGGKNTGTVIAANESYRGLIGANISKFTSISGVTVGGKLGVYKADGNHEMIDVNAGNFMDYIGNVAAAYKEKVSDLKWDGSPAPTKAGINTAADLVEFADLVNSGGDYSKFVVDGAVVVNNDLDLAGAEFVPIGNGSVTTSAAITGASFSGVFNGQGHTIDNFKMSVAATAESGYAAGLFGVLNAATVKNVVIGSKAVYDGKSAALSYIGGVAGFALNSTVEGCTNNATMSITGVTDNIRECLAGIVGEIYASGGEGFACYVKNCTNNGVITSVNTVNTKNGATGLSVAGIVGFSDAATTFNYIQNCTNKVAITAQATRQAGIVASANTYTKVEDCVNEGKISGSDVKATNSRIAGICSAASTETYFTRCINRGDIEFSVDGDTAHGYAAGILGQGNNPLTIEACENYGCVVSDMFKAADPKYMGIILGNANGKKVTIKSCKVGGKIGPKVEDADFKTVTITAENFASYITLATSKAGSCVISDNVFAN